MSGRHSLFIEMNDENAWDLWLRTPEEFLRSVEAGAKWVQDESTLANQYAMATSLLRDAAQKSGTPWFYAPPILFLYRHALELHLKGLVPQAKPTHDLLALWECLATYVDATYGHGIRQGWAAETVAELASVDHDSTHFRYARDIAATSRSGMNKLSTLVNWRRRWGSIPDAPASQNGPDSGAQRVTYGAAQQQHAADGAAWCR
jgi:hypothetical protein